jgi:hypothetical protein
MILADRKARVTTALLVLNFTYMLMISPLLAGGILGKSSDSCIRYNL